jgi:hypothetical protein
MNGVYIVADIVEKAKQLEQKLFEGEASPHGFKLSEAYGALVELADA